MKKKFFLLLSMVLSVCFIFAGCSLGLKPGQRYFTIASSSMEPSGFKIGDRIVLEDVFISDIKIGDFIAFYNCPEIMSDTQGTKDSASDFKTGQEEYDSSIIFHQVYKITYDSEGNTWFYTYGTNNLKPGGDSSSRDIEENYYVDLPTRGDYVVGRYLRHASGFKVNNIISGSVSFVTYPVLDFVVEDVECLINASISGSENEINDLELLYNSESEYQDLRWPHQKIYFNDNNDDIILTITINNYSTERNLYISVIDYNSEDVDIKIANQNYVIGDEVQLLPETSAVFTITFSAENYADSELDFNYDICLY